MADYHKELRTFCTMLNGAVASIRSRQDAIESSVDCGPFSALITRSSHPFGVVISGLLVPQPISINDATSIIHAAEDAVFDGDEPCVLFWRAPGSRFAGVLNIHRYSLLPYQRDMQVFAKGVANLRFDKQHRGSGFGHVGIYSDKEI